MAFVAERGGKPIVRASVLEAETLAQFGHRAGEVAHGQVGAVGLAQQGAHVALAEGTHRAHTELSAYRCRSNCLITFVFV